MRGSLQRRLWGAGLLCLLLPLLYTMWILVQVYSAVWGSGLPGGGNGPADAYRHSLASALVSYTLSPRVIEAVTRLTERHADAADAMDRHNNRLGARIGAQAASLADTKAQIRRAVNAGQVYAPNDDQITWMPPSSWQNDRFY